MPADPSQVKLWKKVLQKFARYLAHWRYSEFFSVFALPLQTLKSLRLLGFLSILRYHVSFIIQTVKHACLGHKCLTIAR